MISASSSPLLIGWDVGAWNCDKNPNSRDALVVLDSQRKLMGKPWRGSLRRLINQSADTDDFVHRLLGLCELVDHDRSAPVVLAIDTPLGFSQGFIDLLVHGHAADTIDRSSENPYLRSVSAWSFWDAMEWARRTSSLRLSVRWCWPVMCH